ncbi:MAG: hypothetical protein ABR551_00075 [Gemmatimonadales bacterium]
MIRSSLAGLLTITLAGCAAPNSDAIPEPSLVLGQASQTLREPRWSPDGSRIAYSKSFEGKSAIFVANADGSNEVRLTFGVWDMSPEWSPDGQWIGYYNDEGFDIYVVPSAGGERRQITSGPESDGLVQWLPDGSGLVIERSGGGSTRTFVAPLGGGEPRPLGEIPGVGINAAVSPDGSRFLMEVERDGQNTIWVQSLSGGEPRQLTTEGFEDPHTTWAWSPDSRSILYESGRTGTLDLWVLDAETGAQRQLTNDVRDDFAGRWSPDGQWVLFLSNRGGQQDLWVVPAAGGNAIRITNDLLVEYQPSWAPDGRSVIYQQDEEAIRLAVSSVAGGAPREVYSWDGIGLIGELQLSPDGSRVIFSGTRAGNQDLWVMGLDGGEPLPLAPSPAREGEGQWSPDGSQIVFTSIRGGTADLWIVPAAGGEPRRLTEWSPADEHDPVWSPDGLTVAFLSNRDAAVTELWTVPAEGGTPTRLTTGAAIGNMAWSPDGQEIYYTGNGTGDAKGLFAVAGGGGVPRRLVPGEVAMLRPSPDGTQVAYLKFEAGWAFLEVVPVGGGAPRRLTTATENVYQTWPQWSADGTMIAVEDADFVTNGLGISVVTLADGTWRRLPQAAADLVMAQPRWIAGTSDLLHLAGDYAQRIVVVPVTSILAPRR